MRLAHVLGCRLVLRRCIRLGMSHYGYFVCVWTDCASRRQHQVYNILSLGTHAHLIVSGLQIVDYTPGCGCQCYNRPWCIICTGSFGPTLLVRRNLVVTYSVNRTSVLRDRRQVVDLLVSKQMTPMPVPAPLTNLMRTLGQRSYDGIGDNGNS